MVGISGVKEFLAVSDGCASTGVEFIESVQSGLKFLQSFADLLREVGGRKGPEATFVLLQVENNSARVVLHLSDNTVMCWDVEHGAEGRCESHFSEINQTVGSLSEEAGICVVIVQSASIL